MYDKLFTFLKPATNKIVLCCKKMHYEMLSSSDLFLYIGFQDTQSCFHC